MVLLAFGASYGASWLAIREKYRASSPPERRVGPIKGSPLDRLRVMLEKETDLVRGTAEMAEMIAQLGHADCKTLEDDIPRTRTIKAPLLYQGAALLQCQMAKQKIPETIPLERPADRSRPPLNAALWQPFARGLTFPNPRPETEYPETTLSFSPVAPDEESSETLYSPIHWALTWLGQHDRAKAYSLIRELGPQWQESQRRWLVDFVWRDGIPGSNPFSDQIGAPVLESNAYAIFERWLLFDRPNLFRWALLHPQERLAIIMDRVSPPGIDALPPNEAEFIAAALDTGLVTDDVTYKAAILRLLDFAPARFAKHLSNRTRTKELAKLCGQLCIREGFGDVDTSRATKLLNLCSEIGDSEFRKDMEQEIRSIPGGASKELFPN